MKVIEVKGRISCGWLVSVSVSMSVSVSLSVSVVVFGLCLFFCLSVLHPIEEKNVW